MSTIRHAALGPLVRSLLTPVRSRPGSLPDEWAPGSAARDELAAAEVDVDDVPPTVRRAA